jgi:lipopolysaccharide export system permease protein
MMAILSRYLVITYLRMIATCLGAFVAIYLVVDFMEKFGKFSRAGAPVTVILLYSFCKIPEMVSQTVPMAVLMGTILAIGMLAKNSEITAMRSSGISLVQIGIPLLATAACISIVLLLQEEFVTPVANEKLLYIEEVVVHKKGKGAFFRQNNIWHRDDNRILQAKFYNPETSTLSGITLWEVDQEMRPVARLAAATASPAVGGWQLHDMTRTVFNRPTGVTVSNKSSEFVKLDLVADDLKVVTKSAEDMGFRALQRYCKTISENGYDATRYQTLMHAKISLPFAALIMAFLGVPFSLKDSRSAGVWMGICFSIVIGFSYFVTNALLLSLGQAGALSPIVAAWAANLLFAGAGLWFTLTVDS